MLNHFRVECLQHISATTKSSATVEMHSISASLRVLSFNVSVYRIIKTCNHLGRFSINDQSMATLEDGKCLDDVVC